jgi:hypothetical protein
MSRWPGRVRTSLSGRLARVADAHFVRTGLPADSYDARFFGALAAITGFTVLTYGLVQRYWDLAWFASEDGLTEWWTVATYVGGAAMAVATTRYLRRAGLARMGSFYLVLATGLLFGALEEISWGQRVFDWSTPEGFAAVNVQGETTLHNIAEVDRIENTLFLIAALVGIGGGIARAMLHRAGRVTSADFVLPSLILAPALALILAWKAGGPLFLKAMEQVSLRPQGGEIPEVLAGLCVLLFTLANLRRARALGPRDRRR